MSEVELRPGEVVEVKSVAEIRATLDAGGRLESLPFMPEMAQFCGRRFVVSKRADKVCDTVHYTGSRRLPGTVLLGDLRCDGSAHGSCQAECRLYWKEQWLRRVPVEAPQIAAATEGASPAARDPLPTEGTTATAIVDGTATTVFRCQATELLASSQKLRTFDPRPYLRELKTGNVSPGRFLQVMARAAWMQPLEKVGLLPKVHVPGSRLPTAPPEATLGLQPGEWVRVKTREQIAATLTAKGRNRGLWFDREMVPFCGKVFRVRKRVQRIVDEQTGRMIELKNDCVTLDGAVCSGERSPSRWFCPRGIFSYWRECWLERVEMEGRPARGSPPPVGS